MCVALRTTVCSGWIFRLSVYHSHVSSEILNLLYTELHRINEYEILQISKNLYTYIKNTDPATFSFSFQSHLIQQINVDSAFLMNNLNVFGYLLKIYLQLFFYVQTTEDLKTFYSCILEAYLNIKTLRNRNSIQVSGIFYVKCLTCAEWFSTPTFPFVSLLFLHSNAFIFWHLSCFDLMCGIVSTAEMIPAVTKSQFPIKIEAFNQLLRLSRLPRDISSELIDPNIKG